MFLASLGAGGHLDAVERHAHLVQQDDHGVAAARRERRKEQLERRLPGSRVAWFERIVDRDRVVAGGGGEAHAALMGGVDGEISGHH